VREYKRTIVSLPFDLISKWSDTKPNLLHFDHNMNNGQCVFNVSTNNNIREGTWGVESPLLGIKSYRTYCQSVQSFVIETKRTGGKAHSAGVYIGQGKEGTGDSSMYDGGLVLIKAGGAQPAGGTQADALKKATVNGLGRIVLDAHEIQLKCNRFLVGEVRDDQKTKLHDLGLGKVMLSLVPIMGAGLRNVGHALFSWFPVRNAFDLKDIT
jgi:hypothetical protein